MDKIDIAATEIINTSVKSVRPILDNKIFGLVIAWIAIINIVYKFDSLSPKVQSIVLSTPVQFLSVFGVIYYTITNVKHAAMYTIVLGVLFYLVTMIKENFDIIYNTPNVIPTCQNVKVVDLLALFGGDITKLKRSMSDLGVPLNVVLTDDNAPLIATMLVNRGKTVSESCRV